MTLKDDSAYDAWNCNTISQARAQGLEDVLDEKFKPTTAQEQELFNEKQKFMYAVFESTLKTDTGKSTVRKYQKTYDAQSVCKEVVAFYVKSTKGALDGGDLLTYITTPHLSSGDWNGTTHAFILHWQDQVRKHAELNSAQQFLAPMKKTMLENAVSDVDALNQV